MPRKPQRGPRVHFQRMEGKGGTGKRAIRLKEDQRNLEGGNDYRENRIAGVDYSLKGRVEGRGKKGGLVVLFGGLKGRAVPQADRTSWKKGLRAKRLAV